MLVGGSGRLSNHPIFCLMPIADLLGVILCPLVVDQCMGWRGIMDGIVAVVGRLLGSVMLPTTHHCRSLQSVSNEYRIQSGIYLKK